MPYFIQDPKRDHHFDNHPFRVSFLATMRDLKKLRSVDIQGLGLRVSELLAFVFESWGVVEGLT